MRKEKTLSSKYYKVYKYAVVFLMVAFVIMYLYMNLRNTNHIYFGITFSALYVFFIIRYWFPSVFKVLRGFREVSYDKENLYINDPSGDTILPLYKIREVELISLDGLYEFKLNPADNLGDSIYVKPSMWYPFNFRKVDNELDEIRTLIRKAKEIFYSNTQSNDNQLNSIN